MCVTCYIRSNRLCLIFTQFVKRFLLISVRIIFVISNIPFDILQNNCLNNFIILSKLLNFTIICINIETRVLSIPYSQ